MHDIEPHFQWRDQYIASEDQQSPFHGRVYNEFQFTQKIYNYYIHPQWDHFGSQTLYMKILFADYEEGFVIMELIGEWNDAIANDVMFLKREVVDILMQSHINKFILICENVLNFHSSDDCYYEEWYDDIKDEGGWITLLNTLDHVAEEMKDARLDHFMNFGPHFNQLNWRAQKPQVVCRLVDAMVGTKEKYLNSGF